MNMQLIEQLECTEESEEFFAGFEAGYICAMMIASAGHAEMRFQLEGHQHVLHKTSMPMVRKIADQLMFSIVDKVIEDSDELEDFCAFNVVGKRMKFALDDGHEFCSNDIAKLDEYLSRDYDKIDADIIYGLPVSVVVTGVENNTVFITNPKAFCY